MLVIKSKLDKLIKDFESGKAFSPEELIITSDDCKLWVRFKVEPQRFLPKIFEGEWALTKSHPGEGSIRMVRIIKGTDDVPRIVARQGRYLYAYPWFK